MNFDSSHSCIIITYLYTYWLIIDSHDDQLPFGLTDELVEFCAGTAEVRVRIPVQV